MKKVNIIRKSMGKILSLIPVSLLVGGAIVVSFLFATGCKKGTNCPDGYDHSIMKSPSKYAMADDPCEEERNAVDQARSDSTEYANGFRPVMYTVMYDLGGVSDVFCSEFNTPPYCVTLPDSADRCKTIVIRWRNVYGDPLPMHNETFCELFDNADVYLNGCIDLEDKDAALKKCEDENPVGITEYEWVKDECGGYWTIK